MITESEKRKKAVKSVDTNQKKRHGRRRRTYCTGKHGNEK